MRRSLSLNLRAFGLITSAGLSSEAGAIILKLAYGYTIEPRKEDPLVDLADEALIQFSLSTTPGAWLVDVMPFRKSSCGNEIVVYS